MNLLNEIGESETRKGPICPFLGLKDDPNTVFSFPSSGNHCFHAKPILPVKLEFQGTHCLSSNHTSCEEFIRRPGTPLLPSLRFERGPKVLRKTNKTGLWVFFLATAVVGLIVWQVFARGLLGFGNPGPVPSGTTPAPSTNDGLSTLPISPTQAKNTSTPTLLRTSSATLPLPTSTPTIKSPHAMETPIALVGLGVELSIHRVMAGESLPSLAAFYWTTAEAIQSVNYRLPLPLIIDWLVIIPVNQTNVQGLPTFEAYEVKSDIIVETLALQLSMDPLILKLYNGLNDGEILSAREWLLIPHVGTATP